MKLSGSYYCGKMHFEATTMYRCPIFWCYCSKCRKCSGSPVSMYVECERSNVRVVKGENDIQIFEEGSNKFGLTVDGE